MKKAIPLLLLLTALAAPALALEQLTEIAPLQAEPSLGFDGVPPGANWISGGWPSLFVIGTTQTPGMRETQALVVAQRAPAGRQTGNVGWRISADGFQGQRVRLSARLKAQDAPRLQMWLTAQRPAGANLTYNMADRPIRGTVDWRRYEIVMDVPSDTTDLTYGFQLGGRDGASNDGKGVAFGESFALEIVGRNVPVSQRYLAADYTKDLGPTWEPDAWMGSGWGVLPHPTRR